MTEPPVNLDAMEKGLIWTEENSFQPGYDGSAEVAKIKAVFAELKSTRQKLGEISRLLQPVNVFEETVRIDRNPTDIVLDILKVMNDRSR